MLYNYLLQSEANNEFYIGKCVDLKKRLKEHNQGLNPSTKRYRPWKLIYYEACLNEKDCTRREGYMKTTQGGRMLKIRLKEYLFDKRSKGLIN